HAGPTMQLGDWRVPLRYGAIDAAVNGHREFHRPIGRIAARLTSSAHPFPGVTATVLPGQVPALYLSSTAASEILVRGAAGEPFARLAGGDSYVNTASPTWSLTAESHGSTPDGVVDPKEPPRWQSIDSTGGFTWLESRAAYAAGYPPLPVERRGR